MRKDDSKIKDSVKLGLKNYYGINISRIEFIPIGEDSYSYLVINNKGTKYLVKYSDTTRIVKNIESINKLLIYLKRRQFIVAPIEVNGFTFFELLSGRIYVFPYIEGDIISVPNKQFYKTLVEELTEIIVSIHSLDRQIAMDLQVEDFNNNFLNEYEEMLDLLSLSKVGNNISDVLKNNEKTIIELIKEHTKLGNLYKDRKIDFVITHGDITCNNIIKTKDGIKIIDWDGVMIAPLERDLIFLIDNKYFSIDKYLAKIGIKDYDANLIKYYNQQWALDSIITNFKKILTQDLNKQDVRCYLNEAKKYIDELGRKDSGQI